MPDKLRRRRPAIADMLETRMLLSGGSLILDGSNTYTAGTPVSGGTLQLGGGGTVSPTPTATTVTLNGFVYRDQDGYGIRENDFPVVAGLTVSLDANGDGVPDASTTTDASGTYQFTGLSPGTYTVSIAVPAGLALTEPTAGGVWTQTVAVGATEFDFGLAFAGQPLTGTAFADANANGADDPGEAGAAGVTVVATGQGLFSERVYRTTTDAAGNYAFPPMPGGTYAVTASLPDTQFATAPFAADNIVNVTYAAAAVAEPIGVAPTAAGATVTGVVFDDANGDGVEDSADAGQYGWSVYLDLNDNRTLDTGEPTVYTNDDGRFTFADLSSGTYTVRADATQVFSDDLGLTTLSTDAVTVTPGESVEATAIGVGPAPVAGTVMGSDGNPVPDATVYLDANGNGRLDLGETTTTTADDGTYRFNDLPYASYTVRLLLPLGQTVEGGDDEQDVTIGNGTATTGHDFTIVPLPTGPLTAAIVTRPARAAVAGGRGSVLVRLSNPGTTPFAGSVPVAVYVSADGSVSTQDVADGQATRSVRLAGGRSTVVSVAVVYPASLVGGDYHLVAAATTSADTAPAMASVAVTADLSPAIVASAAGVAMKAGGSIVVVRLANLGTVTASGSATVVVAAVASDGTVLATIGSTTAARVSVQAGRSTSVRVHVTPPPGVAAGTYMLVAVVTSVTSPADADPTDDASPAVSTR